MAEKQEQEITSEQFLTKLKQGLQINGDFPACAKTVDELKTVAASTSSPGSKIAELILRDPSLSTKILIFVNSAFFQRGTPITTISQAIMHIGTNQLVELCSSFTLIQKLIPTARKGGPFALALERLISTSILTSTLNSQTATSKKDKESGYLLGTFSELGIMLTAYYFPKLFENAHNRSKEKNISLNTSIKQLTGFTPLEISLEVLNTLKTPAVYSTQVLTLLDIKNGETSIESADPLSKNLLIAQEISSFITEETSKKSLSEIIDTISKKYNIEKEKLNNSLVSFTKEFPDYCQTMEIVLPEIEILNSLPNEESASNNSTKSENNTDQTPNDQLTIEKYLNDIQEGIENFEPTASIITTAMEACMWGLKFEKVLLLLVNKERTALKGRMLLGEKNISPLQISLPLEESNQKIPVKSFLLRTVITDGGYVFLNDSSALAIPIGNASKCIGVIYASFANSKQTTIPYFIKHTAEVIFKQFSKITSI